MKTQFQIDWPFMRTLADYSDKAYRDCSVEDKNTGAGALVTNLGADVIVAFRGSKTPRDFIQDAKFGFTPLIYSRYDSAQPTSACVHSGFLQDFDALNTGVVEQVKQWMATLSKINPSPKIFITGHSLGGALAVLCALEFARIKLPLAKVVTLGQPRVGNKAFRDLYNRSPFAGSGASRLGDITAHVINADDPVPLLPPLLCGYRDEGNEIYLPKKFNWQLNPPIGFQLVGDILGAFNSWRRRKLAFLPNHFLSAYRARIQLA